MPDYTDIELFEWVEKQVNFNEIYNNWVDSGYKKEYIPSVDRIDDYKPYTIDNIQLLTWRENRIKSHNDQVNGVNTKHVKEVMRIKNGETVTYYSIAEASRRNNVCKSGISNVISGRAKTCGGFEWSLT